jgi:GNAT superfamily N-acetyltransferase
VYWFIEPTDGAVVMTAVTIRRGTRADVIGLLKLVLALARFEHLEPPSMKARERLIDDIFNMKRAKLLVADEAGELVGYALYFYNYSSFVAKRTLYLEDLFVLKSHRKKGVGFRLFRRCVDEAIKEGCGRMEWAVLTWNRKAISFYEKMGAKPLDDWKFYRLEERGLAEVPKKLS